MSFEVTVTPTVYNVEVEVNPSVQPFDVQVITQQDLADLVDEAKQYAEDAEDSADSASASASSASASATTATNQANIATNQALLASAARLNAQNAANAAEDSADASALSASSALASATSAELDAIATAADRVQTGLDRVATGADRVQTGLDRVATGADRVQTGIDANTASTQAGVATTQAGIATTQAGIATTQAGNALTSANNALNSANAAAASAASAAQTGTSTLLTGFATGANTTILGTDTILGAFQKAQGQINARVSGTGASGQVSFWSGTGSQTGSNNLFWDNTNQIFRITGSSVLPFLVIDNSTISGDVYGLEFRRAGTLESSIIHNRSSGELTISSGRNTSWGGDVVFVTDTIERWRISNLGILQSSGAQTIQTSTGALTLQSGNRNVLINTTTDAGFRLDVNGTARVQGALTVTTGGASITGLSTVQGTTASDSGQLGAELLTTGTGDASWTGSSFATGYTHVAGSTTTLTSTLAGVVNNFYQITYTVTNRTAGSFTIAFGGFTSSALTATGAVGPRATTTDTLVITPTSDFNGTIVLSIRVITASSASVTFNNSAGTVTNQIRISGGTTNTFIGVNSGRNNTTGFSNSFFGATAGQNNTTGINNSFFGRNSGFSNIIGINNTANGTNALFSNTTGNDNTAIGVNAIFSSNTGNSNTAIGSDTLFSNTTGSSNTVIGRNALFSNTTGGSNTAIGVSAGRFLANGSTALTIANNSVFLGADTRANADNETNQIVIGHTAIGLGSNTTVIGNSSTTFGRWWGNLLIGTSTNQASSVLTMESTTRGFLPPRMTSTERNAIATPATGLVVYNTTDNRLSVYNGTAWVNLATV